MKPAEPYLSVVVTTRNDDHGGSLMRRTQTFVNAWIAQCKRHALSAELIFVEWNPPKDRPPLRDALRWPDDFGPCQVRFIQVPPAVHASFRHSRALPLYQMIGKNVGIRRARGRFVLATNIDILFSDELAAFLSSQSLLSGCMYRIDRHDVLTDVPVDATVEDRLAFCSNNRIRVNAREGVFPLASNGQRAPAKEDVVDAGSGIEFGDGWFSPEKDASGLFRWGSQNACLTVVPPSDPPPPLVIEIAPGPGMQDETCDLEFLDGNGSVLLKASVAALTRLEVELPRGGGPQRIILRTKQKPQPVSHDLRFLDFRVHRCLWGSKASAEIQPAPAAVRPGIRSKIAGVLRRAAGTELFVPVWVPVPGPVRGLLRSCLRIRDGQPQVSDKDPGAGRSRFGFASKIAGILRRAATNGPFIPVWVPVPGPVRAAIRIFFPPLPERRHAGSRYSAEAKFLHTNACGDFTLMARQHWFDLRGYPEWDMYSFHIDSALCYAAHHAGAHEVALNEPMRIYHIEHGAGSGWTPEGEQRLFDRLKQQGIPWLEYQDLVVMATQMRKLETPMIFNKENWGLGNLELPETALLDAVNRA